jgi:hypothetical protein
MHDCQFRVRFAIAALMLTLCCVGYGQTQSNEQWGLDRLMIELGRVQHAKGRFIERKYMKALSKPLELSGTLEYEAPERLVKQTLKPKPESMIVEADSLTLERGGRQRTLRLQDYPVLWAFVESIRSTLKGDLAALQRFYEVRLDGSQRRWNLSLQPKDRKMAAFIDVIRIGGGQGKIETIEVREAKGDRSVMTVVEDPK